ncbi:MAG TPA: hypothetical protein DHW82_10425 [Spirochaetia bacterium]|nr:MAG: hypothetical protein A2Y41_00165 [Spirochaetes bacterium GWB1_36_13]HCL57407.1 hypothetical protein [Spirochaetia bacterium]
MKSFIKLMFFFMFISSFLFAKEKEMQEIKTMLQEKLEIQANASLDHYLARLRKNQKYDKKLIQEIIETCLQKKIKGAESLAVLEEAEKNYEQMRSYGYFKQESRNQTLAAVKKGIEVFQSEKGEKNSSKTLQNEVKNALKNQLKKALAENGSSDKKDKMSREMKKKGMTDKQRAGTAKPNTGAGSSQTGNGNN